MRFLAALFGAFIAATPASAADKAILMLNWYVYSEHAPFFYGKEKGFYAEQGIDLDIQEGRGSAVTTQAVAAKSATFGYVDVPTMIRAAAKGAPVVAVGVLLQKTPMSAMGFADKNIRKPEDIRGKTVAVTPGDSMSQIWPLFLKQTGLKESEFQTVAGDAQTKLNAVINGRADLLLGYPMDQGIKILDATGKRVHPILFGDYGITLVSSGIVTNKDFAKENADLVRRFMAASVKAVEAAEKDPEGAVDAILKFNPKGGKRETLLEGFRQTMTFYKLPDSGESQPFRVSDKVMTETVENLVTYGGLEASAKENPKAYYTNEYLPKP